MVNLIGWVKFMIHEHWGVFWFCFLLLFVCFLRNIFFGYSNVVCDIRIINGFLKPLIEVPQKHYREGNQICIPSPLHNFSLRAWLMSLWKDHIRGSAKADFDFSIFDTYIWVMRSSWGMGNPVIEPMNSKSLNFSPWPLCRQIRKEDDRHQKNGSFCLPDYRKTHFQ